MKENCVMRSQLVVVVDRKLYGWQLNPVIVSMTGNRSNRAQIDGGTTTNGVASIGISRVNDTNLRSTLMIGLFMGLRV